MISGATISEQQLPTLGNRLWAARASVVLFFCGAVILGCGNVAAIRNGTGLPFLALPRLGGVLIALTAWRLAVAIFVVPRQTVVWFKYDQRTLEYRRYGDIEVHRCRTLDIVRVAAITDRRGEVVHYSVSLASGKLLVLDRKSLENGDALAEQLAADIAHSPRWMFS